MELVAKVWLGLWGVMALGFGAGFVDAWWTQRQRDKKWKKGGNAYNNERSGKTD